MAGRAKSNIGHSQAAAGVAGVIKTVLAMRHGRLPRTLHTGEPSPQVDWSSGAVRLLTREEEWHPAPGSPRRAGVSALGISGTNAHVIVEEAMEEAMEEPAPEDAVRATAVGTPDPLPDTPARGPWSPPLLLSAASPRALRAQARQIAAELRELPEADLADIAFSLATTRAALAHRAALPTADHAALLTALDALATDGPAPTPVSAGRLALTFSGQGSQQHGCFPGFSPSPGGRWYRTLAGCFGGERDVLEIQHPGVVHGDAVPRDWETLVDLHAATVREHVGDRPHVLLGYSMGGYPAHSVAARLASAGTPPSGLVIVDTYHVTPDREDEPWLPAMPARVPLEMGERFDLTVDDTSMAALGAYARMTRGWRPEPAGVPTLLVRATERVPEMRTHGGREAHGGACRTSWLEPYDTVDVPGDHRSMTEPHARTTAEAIRAWLTALGTTPRTGRRDQTAGAG